MKNNTRYNLSFVSFLALKGKRLPTVEFRRFKTQREKTSTPTPSSIVNTSFSNFEIKFESAGCRKDAPGVLVSPVVRFGQAIKQSNLLSYTSLFRHLERKYKR